MKAASVSKEEVRRILLIAVSILVAAAALVSYQQAARGVASAKILLSSAKMHPGDQCPVSRTAQKNPNEALFIGCGGYLN